MPVVVHCCARAQTPNSATANAIRSGPKLLPRGAVQHFKMLLTHYKGLVNLPIMPALSLVLNRKIPEAGFSKSNVISSQHNGWPWRFHRSSFKLAFSPILPDSIGLGAETRRNGRS